MKRFLKDNSGSALIWSIFLILILMTLSVVIYTGLTVYSIYQTCETEVQHAATVTVSRNMLNANVRDMILDIPAGSAEESFYASLTEAGWMLEDRCWNRYKDERLTYSLEDMAVDVDGKTINISALLAITLPWDIGNFGIVHIPMNVRSSVLYIE